MLKIYSSKVVPSPGVYRVSHVDLDEAREIIDTYRQTGIESYVGYDSTADFARRMLGIQIHKNKSSDPGLKVGDVILVIKIRGRMSFDEKIHLSPSDSDYEFAKIELLSRE